MLKAICLSAALAVFAIGSQAQIIGFCGSSGDADCNQRCQAQGLAGTCVQALIVTLCVCSPGTTSTTTTTTVAPFTCDEGWTLFRQSCYRLSSTWGGYTFGSIRCERSGAGVHMVTISDAAENDFVNQFTLQQREVTGCADSGIASACRVYVGLRRCAGCAEYIWSDATPFGPESYENWADGEPNTPQDAGACVEMLDNGEWNDLACDNSRLSVCEKPANPVQPAPEPAK